MNKEKLLRWLAEQVFYYDTNNKPFKYFNFRDFEIDEEEWNKVMFSINDEWKEEEEEE